MKNKLTPPKKPPQTNNKKTENSEKRIKPYCLCYVNFYVVKRWMGNLMSESGTTVDLHVRLPTFIICRSLKIGGSQGKQTEHAWWRQCILEEQELHISTHFQLFVWKHLTATQVTFFHVLILSSTCLCFVFIFLWGIYIFLLIFRVIYIIYIPVHHHMYTLQMSCSSVCRYTLNVS